MVSRPSNVLYELVDLLLGGPRSSGTSPPAVSHSSPGTSGSGVSRVRVRLVRVAPWSKPSEGRHPAVHLDVVAQLGVGGAHLTADPALSLQLVRPSPGHLVAVGVGDVIQEDFLGQTDE